MEAELMSAAAQFGVAGLIGWMWLSERRSSAERERQIDQSHRRITEHEHDRAALIGLVREATRAMVALETGQRALVAVIERSVRAGHEHGDRGRPGTARDAGSGAA